MFGTFAQFLILSTDLPAQKERVKRVKTAQAGTNKIIVQHRVFESLARNISAAVKSCYRGKKNVFVYSEVRKKLNEPLIVVGVERRIVAVENSHDKLKKTLNLFQVKPIYEKFTQNFNIFSFSNPANFQAQTEYLTKVINPHDPGPQKIAVAIKMEIMRLSSLKRGS